MATSKGLAILSPMLLIGLIGLLVLAAITLTWHRPGLSVKYPTQDCGENFHLTLGNGITGFDCMMVDKAVVDDVTMEIMQDEPNASQSDALKSALDFIERMARGWLDNDGGMPTGKLP